MSPSPNATPHTLYAHKDVLDAMALGGPLGRRLNLVCSHLAAHGRTSVVKSCKDTVNRGWLRTPVAGNNRYLWWARHSSEPADASGFPDRSIVLRAVRHHDDHQPLQVDGGAENYLPLTQENLQDESFMPQPWTPGQLSFIHSHAAVRILAGNPGSGKTTALWRAIVSGGHRKVLYLTWSPKLARLATEHFESFGGAEQRVLTRDLRAFWSEILGRDLKHIPHEQSHSRFKQQIGKIDRAIIGPWASAHRALHAEARAVMYGMSDPAQGIDGLSRLSASEYRKLRKRDLGAHADPVPRIVDELVKLIEPERWIPELAAACEAVCVLQDRSLPDAWADIDCIVIDEVQDLTLLELRVLLHVYRKIAEIRTEAPVLLIAGDEGQTVVPTHFRWGKLKNTVEESMSKLAPGRMPGSGVEDIRLDSNLRCPGNVRDVLDRASDLYARLAKLQRPGNQTPPDDGDLHDARLIHATCDTLEEARDLLQPLMEQEDLVVICLDESIKTRLARLDETARELASRMLSPEEAKGLEFQSICILNPGPHLHAFEELAKGWETLDSLAARTHLDQFRVAVSRATGDLVFLDVCCSPGEIRLSSTMLGSPIETGPAGLLRFFEDNDITPEARVASRLKLSRELVDRDLHRAWGITVEAFKLLGKPGLTNGVEDREIRRETAEELLTQATLLLANDPDGRNRTRSLRKLANEAADESGSGDSFRLFHEFEHWAHCDQSRDRTGAPKAATELFEAITEAESPLRWIEPALSACAQRLRADLLAAPADQTSAAAFTGPVATWLSLTGEIGDPTEREAQLRTKAAETLIRSGDLETAAEILKRIPENPRLTGMLHEAHGRHEPAALSFEAAGETACALRNWRAHGNWAKALEHATGDDASRLQWLQSMTELLATKPAGLHAWMTRAENHRYRDALETLAKRDETRKAKRNGGD